MKSIPSGNNLSSLIEQYNRELMRAYQRSSLPQEEAAPVPTAPEDPEDAIVAFPAAQPDRAVSAPPIQPEPAMPPVEIQVAQEVSPADYAPPAEEATMETMPDATMEAMPEAVIETMPAEVPNPPADTAAPDSGTPADIPTLRQETDIIESSPIESEHDVAVLLNAAETDTPADTVTMSPPAPAADATALSEGEGAIADSDGETASTAPPVSPTGSGNPANPSGLPETDTGYLQVQVYTAQGAVPIPGAYITISRDNSEGEELFTLTFSDSNGFSPLLPVPTVSSSLSQQPGTPAPFSTYNIRVDVPGYFTMRDLRVPVYGGVTSVQPAAMIPLPENYQGDTSLSYVEGGPSEL